MLDGGLVEVERHRGGRAGGEGRVEQAESLVGDEFDHAPAVDAEDVGTLEPLDHALVPAPQAPRDGVGRQAGGGAVLGEGVEEEVGGGVVALAGTVHHAGGRGEHDEGGQRQVAGQLVQVPGGVGLRAEHVVDLVGGQRLDDAVVGDARGVHDGGERVVRADAGEQVGERLPFGDVARLDPHVRARLGQLGDQLRGAVGGHAAPAGQQQVADTVLGDQMTGDERAQPSGAAGDEHRTVGVPRGRGLRVAAFGGGGQRFQPGDAQGSARIATSGSPVATAAASAASEAGSSSRSTRTKRPGVSACAERTSPRRPLLPAGVPSSVRHRRPPMRRGRRARRG